MSLLEQNTTKKGQVNNLLESELEFDARKDKEYKVAAIMDSIVYAVEVAEDQLLRLYYLVS